MTRLRSGDLQPIPANLARYDADLKRKTGLSLRQIACRAAGIPEEDLCTVTGQVKFAAVPVSSGLGIIEGFAGAVGSIVTHLGFRSFLTENHDVAGVAEALERGSDILMLADDERFVAIAPARQRVVDNVGATARGFVAGLEAMRGEVAGASVLVLGCGPVGVAGAAALLERGATVSLLDEDRDRAVSAVRDLTTAATTPIILEDGGVDVLRRYELIFEATNSGGFIEPHHLTSKTLMAAPGMPCALTKEALIRHGDRLLHDALEIGTATMAVEAAGGFVAHRGTERTGGA